MPRKCSPFLCVYIFTDIPKCMYQILLGLSLDIKAKLTLLTVMKWRTVIWWYISLLTLYRCLYLTMYDWITACFTTAIPLASVPVIPLSHSLTVVSILTHWGRVTHICVSELTIIGSDNGLSPGRRQAIIWNNVGILLIGPLGTNFIQENAFESVVCEMRAMLSRPQCVNSEVVGTPR